MNNQVFYCPRCQAQNAIGARFCSSCGVQYTVPPNIPNPTTQNFAKPAAKQKLPGWAIAIIASVSLCGLCGLVGNLAELNKPDNSNTVEQVNANQQPANIPAPSPPPPPTFAELKEKGERLLKFEKNEYETGDLKQFDDVMTPLKDIPKDSKDYKSAQAMIKKLIDKSSVIGAEIVVLGPKPTNSAWDGSVLPADKYLKETLNDYDSAEYMNWSPVTKVYVKKEPFWATRVKLRAKNGFGAFIVRDIYFFIRNNQVVNVEGL